MTIALLKGFSIRDAECFRDLEYTFPIEIDFSFETLRVHYEIRHLTRERYDTFMEQLNNGDRCKHCALTPVVNDLWECTDCEEERHIVDDEEALHP